MQELIINLLLFTVVLASALILFFSGRRKSDMRKKQKIMMLRIFIASSILLLLQLLSTGNPAVSCRLFSAPSGRLLRLAAYLLDYLIISYDILRKAAKGLYRHRFFDECFLMALATLGAMALAIYENGDYLEAISVMLLYQIGEWFQSYAVGKSRRSISELMDIRPDYANIEVEGRLTQVSPDDVSIGSTIVVRPGEKIPIDGTVAEGSSILDTSALTGESLPKEVSPGDNVISGCLSMSGVLKITTTREFGESTVSKILDLVENASSRKSKTESFISKFARVYTPIVCFTALALALFPPCFRLVFTSSAPQWGSWLYRALTFLVISCPCALVISVPLSFFAGIGGSGQAGILVKGSNYLELLSRAQIVVFDKTGTLTRGVFEVSEIHHSQAENETLLEYAALAEIASSHPISKSLQAACGKELDPNRVSKICELSGKGVTAVVDGQAVAVGNDKLMQQLSISYKPCHNIGTVIHIAIAGKYAGHIVISDVVKPGSAKTVSELKKLGIRKTVILSGDSRNAVEQLARTIGTDEAYSELLPADKVAKTEELLVGMPKGGKLIFAGDGINDAPVLALADIGIAMGAMGSDAAIEAADVVLMDDDPVKIVKAIKISRKCMRIVYQNIIFALAVKAICLVLGASGIAGMYLAIFADVGVMILAVLNAIRCLFVQKL